MQLFRNIGNGNFLKVGHLMQVPLQDKILGRGIAVGDLFNSGNVDVLVSTNDSTPLLLRNDTKNGHLISQLRRSASTATASEPSLLQFAPAGGRRNPFTAAVPMNLRASL